MKLYYSPALCSLAPHIVLCECGLEYELERVDLKTKQTESGDDFNAINEKGLVPFLCLDSGEAISEVAAILQYLADRNPDLRLAPEYGSFERTRLQEWLNYIATEMHKTHWPIFFSEQAGAQAKGVYIEKLKKVYSYLSDKLQNQSYLMGDQFTIADAYLFAVTNWHKGTGLDLEQWPSLANYQKRIATRPAVQQAMRAEGLLK